jgi:DNA-binding transcriptional ArsR family regulator
VLEALKDAGAMTAGEIAAATGLGRATVSTTLSKLAASGEITKAARGYQFGRESDTTRKPPRPRPSVAAATSPSPLVAEEPVAELPVAEELAAELLVAEELAAEELVAEELVAEELVAEELAVEELVAEELAVEELVAEELVAEELAVEELVAEELVTEELAVEELVAEELAVEELVAEELVAEELVTEPLVGEAPAAGAARPVSGATKRAVLEALAGGSAMTAGEVAAATGLARASVSTTLSKLAKAGELTKAARGYQLAGAESSQRFYFRTEDAGAGAVVANLPELEAAIAVCEAGVLRAHCAERDFSRWVAGVLRNESLAAEIAAVEEQLSADSPTESVEHARQALIAALQARHATEQ